MTKIRKFVVAAVAAVGTAVSLGLLPEDANKWVAVAIAAFGAAGVYVVSNKDG